LAAQGVGEKKARPGHPIFRAVMRESMKRNTQYQVMGWLIVAGFVFVLIQIVYAH